MTPAIEALITRRKARGSFEPGTAPVRITCRVGPCRCGCGGRDPWHVTRMKRVVKDFREVREVVDLSWIRGVTIVARGRIRSPWGFHEVGLVVAENREVACILGWSLIAGGETRLR